SPGNCGRGRWCRSTTRPSRTHWNTARRSTMPDPVPPHPPAEPGATEPLNPEVRFERKDANVRYIVLCAVALVVVAAVTHLVLRAVLEGMRSREKPAGPVQPLLSQERLRLPADMNKVPEPRLQVSQETDMEQLRAYEEKLLDNKDQPYAWVDAKAGVV